MRLELLLFWSNCRYWREQSQLTALPGSADGAASSVIRAQAWTCAGLWAQSEGDTPKATACLVKAKSIWRSTLAARAEIDFADARHVSGRVPEDVVNAKKGANYRKHRETRSGCWETSTDVCRARYMTLLEHLVLAHCDTVSELRDVLRKSPPGSLNAQAASDYLAELEAFCADIGPEELGRVKEMRRMSPYLVMDRCEAEHFYAEVLKTEPNLDAMWCLRGVAYLAAADNENGLAIRLFAASERIALAVKIKDCFNSFLESTATLERLTDRIDKTTYEAEWQRGMAMKHTDAIALALDFCLRK